MADLNRLLEKLLKSDLRFVLVGGFAGVVHGSSQVTRDIDICMDVNPKTITYLRSLLAEVHPFHRQTPKKLSFLEHPSDLTHVRNLYLQTTLGPLDILSEIMGVGSFADVSAHSITIPLFGHNCPVLGLNDLIRSKELLGREKDRASLAELKAIADRKT